MTMTITTSNTARIGVKKKATKTTMHVGRISIAVITVTIMFLLGLFYILQVNEVSTMGYEINTNDEQINTLEGREKELKVEEAKLRALRGLEQEVEKLNYNDVERIEYTSPVDLETSETIVQR